MREQSGGTFFLQGAAGTGKTFLYKYLCQRLRGEYGIVLCVASTGIIAQLLIGGRTAHSMFKIPIDDLHEGSTCHIDKQSARAELLRQTTLIIWDEAPAQCRYTHEALNRTLQDILDSDQPFGGVTVVFGRDFQQILPVVPKGTQQEIINASLPRSQIWHHVSILRLHRNMRLGAQPEEAAFAQWLLDIAHGLNSDDEGMVEISEHMI